MGMSGSHEQRRSWRGGAFVFSGRPDPVWAVPEEAARKLEEVWKSLEPWPGPHPPRPPLGYRGAFLQEDDLRQWVAFQGVVTLHFLGKSESRGDPGRVFERLLLETSPKGTLPGGLLQETSSP